MRTLIGVLCFIVVAFINPIQSMLGRFIKKKDQYQQLPKTNAHITHPKLSAHVYTTMSKGYQRNQYADPGEVRVGIMVEERITYVMGYIGRVGESDQQPLCPFVHNKVLHGGWGRIRIRVDGDYAYQYVVISDYNDPLHDLFYKTYEKYEIRTFEIVIGPHARALVRFIKPAAPRQASSSRGLVKPRNWSPKLSAHVYLALSGKNEVIQYAEPALVRVGIVEEKSVVYVIGYIGKENVVTDSSPIHPFSLDGLKVAGRHARIKIRVERNYAYKYVIIPDEDKALKDVFYKPYPKKLFRIFEIVPPSLARSLEPFNPTVPGHASSSQTLTSAGQAGLHQGLPQNTQPPMGRLLSLARSPERDNAAGSSTSPHVENVNDWQQTWSYRQ